MAPRSGSTTASRGSRITTAARTAWSRSPSKARQFETLAAPRRHAAGHEALLDVLVVAEREELAPRARAPDRLDHVATAAELFVDLAAQLERGHADDVAVARVRVDRLRRAQ